MVEKIRKGEVYISKKGDQSYALIVEGFDGQRVIVRNSSSRDTEHDFIGYTSFLELYEKANPKQLEGIMASLREKQGVVAQKISLLEQYVNTQPA